MRNLFWVLAGAVLVAGCAAGPKPVSHVEIQPYQPPAPKQVDPFKDLLEDNQSAGKAVEVGDVAIVPILNPKAPADCDYLTLQEAMQAKQCTVREKEGVNGLAITSTAKQPLFLMVGDLVLGGKQDRIVAESMVIEPGAKDEVIPVFCVEHGRWTPEEGNAASEREEFYSRDKSEQVDVSVKRQAIGGSQQAVWDAVGFSNARLGVEGDTETGAFRAAFDDPATMGKLDRMTEQAAKAKSNDAVGYSVLMNNEVVALDAFDSRGLCAKLADKLLRSYLLTAITGGYAGPPEHPLTNRLKDTVSIEAKDAPLSEVVAALNAQWSVTILLDRDDDPKVTISMKDQPMIAVLDRLAGSTRGEAWVCRGSVRLVGEGQSFTSRFVGGIAPENPSAGIFFNNSDGSSVNFNQDVRGRFEHIFDRSHGGQVQPQQLARIEQSEGSLGGLYADVPYQNSATTTASRRTPRTAEEMTLLSQLEDVQVTLFVENAPLADVVSKLEAEGEVTIRLDESGVDPDSEVSLDSGRTSIRALLDLLCDELQLAWVPSGNSVFVYDPNETYAYRGNGGPAQVPEAAAQPNAQTQTERSLQGDKIEYTCTDKKRGSTVHRSFVRR